MLNKECIRRLYVSKENWEFWEEVKRYTKSVGSNPSRLIMRLLKEHMKEVQDGKNNDS